jgi:GDP-mannose 6-dehydrogenase
MNVSVFGLGYVGCVTAACAARDGHHVTGVDVNEDKVAMINAGASPIVEPGLHALVGAMVGRRRLSATRDAADALHECDVALVCVGTPDIGHGQQDLRALERVTDVIADACTHRRRPLTVVLRSTVLPGTTRRVFAPLISAARETGVISIAVNPEFMREGSSLADFDHPPFVLVGCDDTESVRVLRELYSRVKAPIVTTSIPTAEMVKYACNAFHALKICFANEMADLCDSLGADAQEVMSVFRQDTKLNVSGAYLRPGFAFGGSCLPKDVRALLAAGRRRDVPLPLLDSIVPSNHGQISRAIERVLATRMRRVGVVGLAFKSNTDDLRESPMVSVVEALIGKGCDLRVYDPNVVLARLKGANRRYIESEIPHIAAILTDSPDELVAHADVLVFGTNGEHAERVLALAEPRHTIVDLTRGSLRSNTTPALGRASMPVNL